MSDTASLMGGFQVDSRTCQDVPCVCRLSVLLAGGLSVPDLIHQCVFTALKSVFVLAAYLCLPSLSPTHKHTYSHRNSHYLISRGSSHLAL